MPGSRTDPAVDPAPALRCRSAGLAYRRCVRGRLAGSGISLMCASRRTGSRVSALARRRHLLLEALEQWAVRRAHLGLAMAADSGTTFMPWLLRRARLSWSTLVVFAQNRGSSARAAASIASCCALGSFFQTSRLILTIWEIAGVIGRVHVLHELPEAAIDTRHGGSEHAGRSSPEASAGRSRPTGSAPVTCRRPHTCPARSCPTRAPCCCAGPAGSPSGSCGTGTAPATAPRTGSSGCAWPPPRPTSGAGACAAPATPPGCPPKTAWFPPQTSARPRPAARRGYPPSDQAVAHGAQVVRAP